MSTPLAAPPTNLRAEEELLGAAMATDCLGAIQAEINLEPSTFYLERHQLIFRAMLSLLREAKPVTEITVAEVMKQQGTFAQLPAGQDTLSKMASNVERPGAAMHYAETIREKSRWRQRLLAGQEIQAAAAAEDNDRFAEGQSLLAEGVTHHNAVFDEDRQRDLIYELLEGRSKPDFYYPFQKLNQLAAGGMRSGQLIVLSGYTNFGKSVLADQFLDVNRKHGSVAKYDNEMEPEEVAVRRLNRLAGVSYSAIMSGEIDQKQREDAMRFLNKQDMGWPIIRCAGWSVDEVCHHIRQYRRDLVVIDLLHNFAFNEERELAAMVRRIKMTGKQANCTIVLCCHVNRKGAEGGKKRPPLLSDLRWSGEIENMADAVCFVHREQEDHPPHDPLSESYIYFAKMKGGKIGGVKAEFNSKYLRFEAAATPGEAGSW